MAKTAIKTFLEKIVLKQVNGIIYLVPAITDVMVEEIKELFKHQIIGAAKEGWRFPYPSDDENGKKKTLQESAEDYYNQKYKQ
jgi:hypothetical protein